MNAWQNGSLLVAALAMTAGACSGVRHPTADVQPRLVGDPATYAWSPVGDDERTALERIDPSLEQRLRGAVERELAERGYVLTSEDEADLLITVHPLLWDRDEHVDADPGVCYRRSGLGADPWRRLRIASDRPFDSGPVFVYVHPASRLLHQYRYSHPAHRRYYYRSRAGSARHGIHYWAARAHGCSAVLGPGTLAVDLIDPRDGEVVWRGWTEGALFDAPGTADDLDEYVDDVVRRALQALPVASTVAPPRPSLSQ